MSLLEEAIAAVADEYGRYIGHNGSGEGRDGASFASGDACSFASADTTI